MGKKVVALVSKISEQFNKYFWIKEVIWSVCKIGDLLINNESSLCNTSFIMQIVKLINLGLFVERQPLI